MPTIIAFDCSLSMSRFISTKVQDKDDVKMSLKSIGHNVIMEIIRYLENYVKLEYVALMEFAAHAKILCNFTRDHASLKHALEMVSATRRCVSIID